MGLQSLDLAQNGSKHADITWFKVTGMNMKSAGGSQTLTIGNICVEEHAAAHFDLSRALFITELALPLAFAEGAWGVPPKCRRARPFCSQKMPPGVPEPQSTQIRC